jgi:hypothetical protein
MCDVTGKRLLVEMPEHMKKQRKVFVILGKA